MSAPENEQDTTAEAVEVEWQVSLTVACYATVTVYAETEDDAREYAREDLSKDDLEIDYIEVDEVTQVTA